MPSLASTAASTEYDASPSAAGVTVTVTLAPAVPPDPTGPYTAGVAGCICSTTPSEKTFEKFKLDPTVQPDQGLRSPFWADGEMASAVRLSTGDWMYLAHYNLGAFDISTAEEELFPTGRTFIHPYFWYGSADGGANHCDESNSDGFDTKDWSIWAR